MNESEKIGETQRADPIEAQAFLYKHADIDSIDLLIPDGNATLRGKRVKAASLAKIYADGLPMAGSLFASLATGDTAGGTELGLRCGDPDKICWPVAGSLHVSPWQPRPSGQVLLAMNEPDNSPFFADPRNVLTRVLERFNALGYTLTVAIELEFYLLDGKRSDTGGPQPPRAPGAGERQSQTQVYGIAELDAFDALLNDIVTFAEQQDLPVDNVVSEYAPGQYEVNLRYQTDPLLACDHALMLKRLVTAVALRHGYRATFMAKPYADWAGNGMHIHLGLRDADGGNALVDADDEQPLGHPLLGSLVAGVIATMAESMALCAPTVNSFRRLGPGAYAPVHADWGFNNRTVGLRVPLGPADSRRVEHRIAGADANPYLVLAAILAGAHYGISAKLTPPEPVSGNGYLGNSHSLPRNLPDALTQFATGQLLTDYLGERFCRLFHQVRSVELEQFNQHVSALEHRWYLE